MGNKAQAVHAAAAAVHKKAAPVFSKSEHAAAVSYALVEFANLHVLVQLVAGALLVSVAFVLFAAGVEKLLAFAEPLVNEAEAAA
jgi:uncharacterized protein (UPF0254 family)